MLFACVTGGVLRRRAQPPCSPAAPAPLACTSFHHPAAAPSIASCWWKCPMQMAGMGIPLSVLSLRHSSNAMQQQAGARLAAAHAWVAARPGQQEAGGTERRRMLPCRSHTTYQACG